MTRVRIATRASPLALAQARGVAARLEAVLGTAAELVPLTTRGDRLRDRPLADAGGKGLFVKEIEEALLDGRADLAVHSAKDLPAELAPGLALAAFPERGDPRDALVGRAAGARLAALAAGARVGTGSARRASQLLARRPDLRVVPLRGNVDTRLRKLEDEGLDAVILACAGLDRLGQGHLAHERVAPEWLLPAPGQGTLALEVREGDPLGARLGALDHAATRAALGAERAFVAACEGDCFAPLAAFAEVEGDRVRLRGLVASPDGSRVARGAADAEVARAADAGRRAAEAALAAGGAEILAALRGTRR